MPVLKGKGVSYVGKENESAVFYMHTAKQKSLLRQRVYRNAEDPDGGEMAGGTWLPHRECHSGGLRRRLHSHLSCSSETIQTFYGLRHEGKVRIHIILQRKTEIPRVRNAWTLMTAFNALGIFCDYSIYIAKRI